MSPKGLIGWQRKTRLKGIQNKIRGHRSVLVGNSLFVFGSFCVANETYFLYVFLLDKLEWRRSLRPAAKARNYHTVVLVDDKVVIYGGKIQSRETNEILVLDLVEMEFLNVEVSGRVPRVAFHSANFVPGRRETIIFGGATGHILHGQTYALNLENKRFYDLQTKGKAPSERVNHASATVGEQVFIYGGYSHVYLRDLYILGFEDHIRGTWSKVDVHGRPPNGRASASLNYYQGWILLFGGFNKNKHYSDTFAYNPKSCNWHPVMRKSKSNNLEGRARTKLSYQALSSGLSTTASDRIVFVHKDKLLQLVVTEDVD